MIWQTWLRSESISISYFILSHSSEVFDSKGRAEAPQHYIEETQWLGGSWVGGAFLILPYVKSLTEAATKGHPVITRGFTSSCTLLQHIFLVNKDGFNSHSKSGAPGMKKSDSSYRSNCQYDERIKTLAGESKTCTEIIMSTLRFCLEFISVTTEKQVSVWHGFTHLQIVWGMALENHGKLQSSQYL